MPATSSSLKAAWSPPLSSAIKYLKAVRDDLPKAIDKAVVGNATLMAADLKRTTPRSSIDRDHVADGWDVKTVRTEDGVVATVENTNPRFNDPVRLKNGGRTTLGLMLEYGTRPHRIEAKPGGVLSFYWPAIGRIVRTKAVEHPGTRAYGFMLNATEAAVARGDKLLNAAAKVIGEKRI